ncbi:glucose 1-dehydrogenase [Paracraurococcus ruber]|uniref:Dehydrogenase n=1 Tax=Paracraurococcus ruber TaxID=77675 RepID=A0ABS1CVL2_9PROT|nr:glucose 1-dehydrogenase [Paracraurococcus ruber]MBK1658553.1 dehydrogenase [Paracraurococcus ruber]TDG30883.1 glucose 1-dehydrogenase [Paracraurococcus ruber]
MGQVQGKVALVTGAAAGIGAAIATTLGREGARVVLTDLDDARGEATAGAIRAAGGDALYLHQDVTDEARWQDVMAEIESRHGRLDVLVANAGIAIIAPIIGMSLADWRRQTAVNIDGVFLSAKHGIPLMRKPGAGKPASGGSIVMISSVAGLRGSAGLAGYSATKGAVRLFAKSVALECAGARDGIRCNSIHPGIIETAIWEKMPAGANDARRNAPLDPRAIAEATVPTGQLGTPQDVANAVLFLASDASSYVNGSEIVVDAGLMAGRVGNLAAR